MTTSTQPYWVCDKCNHPLVKTGAKGVTQLMLEHRKTCHQLACFSIKQVDQRELSKIRKDK